MAIELVCLLITLAPLAGAVISGLFREQIGRSGAHSITIALVMLSFVLSLCVAKRYLFDGATPFNGDLYTWASGGDLFPYAFHVGFLIDSLTAIMLVIVTFVSMLVHLYSIGYMAEDDGYQRFFSYISLFTFAMLMLVTSNNFLQLFFGWEGVGLVSYLLIGFWYTKESAIESNMKAFLVNRVGDFGFILGIGLLLAYTGSLDFAEIFAKKAMLADSTISIFDGSTWSLVTVICLCLFVGAMGKSAQVPLHVWLPESMEGPTPISALIHAATMVTAGVFMIARMSPLFELSETALSVILIIGATGAFFTGLLGIVMNDIKRVVAYSTLSQLGYMMVAMGVSAYSAGIFHLATHACFKALLFLGAGSVIIGMHHEQDMRKMGGLWKYMPITYATSLIGALALCAIPPFAGFFSKDTIINAAAESHLYGATYASYCVSFGAFVTALYTFRQIFMTFHGKPRMDKHTKEHLQESPWVVWLPLIILAIPSVFLGWWLMEPMLYAKHSLLANAITVLPSHDVLAEMPLDEKQPLSMMMHSLASKTFMLTLLGIFTAWVGYIAMPSLPEMFAKRFSWIHKLLLNKYGFDAFNEQVLMPLTRGVGQFFSSVCDKGLIDGFVVNGAAKLVNLSARVGRLSQTGFLFHYAFAMVAGLLIFILWLI